MDHGNSFTIHGDPKIDSTISRHITLIVEKILKFYPKVDSIFLTGGFGRGEGSILISDENVVPISDYDICVISDFSLDRMRVKRMLEEINATSGATAPLIIDLDVTRKENLTQLVPDISSYELKVASKLLYGKDLRSLIQITKSDLATSSGFITLCIRAISMSRVATMLHVGNLNIEERARCVYECSRAFTEIATALSLLKGFYRPSYNERALLFNEFFDDMKTLRDSIPDLPLKVKEYTDIKLWSRFDKKTPEEAFEDVSIYLKPSFLYFLSEYLGVKFWDEDWELNARMMYTRLRRLFLRPYIIPFLRRRNIPKSLEGPLNLAFQLLNNLMFVKNTYQAMRTPYFRSLISWCSPLVKTFISANLLFYSLDGSMRINPETIKFGYKYLIKVYPCKTPFLVTDWTRWDVWEKLRETNWQAFQISLLTRQKKPF